jgi:hypothetical protein
LVQAVKEGELLKEKHKEELKQQEVLRQFD